jgi:glucosamine 6-phosphate synthetase-like amidotransferase/phosphosugar isomerase protein
MASAPSLIVIGRGPTLAIAREAALKEVANLHAEASAAPSSCTDRWRWSRPATRSWC